MKVIPITSWSYSRLSVWEQCKFRAQLQYGQKIPEPERPLPPGKTEHANDRGTRIHDAAEQFVRGTGPFIKEMESFRPEFESLRTLFLEDRVSLEGEWGMDQNWDPCSWDSAWQRLKLDALVFLSDYEAVVIDYKSGKKYGNEIKHAEQCQSYQLNTFLRYPQLEIVHTELWYLDQNDITCQTYSRNQGLKFRHSFNRRALAMTTATEFPANPTTWTCRYCAYSTREGGTGHCDKGVDGLPSKRR